jgi:hypothetical protein
MFFVKVELTEMKHNRLSMKNFSNAMADKMSNYTKLELVCMIPSKIECHKNGSCQLEIMEKTCQRIIIDISLQKE